MFDTAHITISIPMNKFTLGSIFETMISKYVSEEDSKYACVIAESTENMISDTQGSPKGITWRSLITDYGEISLHRKITTHDVESVRQKLLDMVGLLRVEKRLAETMLDNPSSKCDVYAPSLFIHRLGISVRNVGARSSLMSIISLTTFTPVNHISLTTLTHVNHITRKSLKQLALKHNTRIPTLEHRYELFLAFFVKTDLVQDWKVFWNCYDTNVVKIAAVENVVVVGR